MHVTTMQTVNMVRRRVTVIPDTPMTEFSSTIRSPRPMFDMLKRNRELRVDRQVLDEGSSRAAIMATFMDLCKRRLPVVDFFYGMSALALARLRVRFCGLVFGLLEDPSLARRAKVMKSL